MRRHKRSGMPNREAIKAHWFPDKFAQFGVARHGQIRDDELVACECWACGDTRRVERCHIVSIEDGGPNTADNLVLLCHSCHVESEYMTPETFWQWMRNSRQTVWRPRHEHAAERLARAGFTEARLGQMLNAMGGDATIDTVFKAIGIEGTAADVRAMFNNGDLV